MNNVEVEDPPREPPRWAWWSSGAGLVAVVLILASMLSSSARHQMALSLFRQDASFTQLAFRDAAALPVTAVRGKPINISFIITNNEGKSVSYQYVVASGSDTKLQSLSSSRKTVASGATWNVAATVLPKCAANPCRVQVSLPGQDEAIDFEFQYKSATKAK